MRRLQAFTAALAVTLACTALAQPGPFTRGFDAVPVKPTMSGSSGIAQDSAKMLAPKSIHAAFLFDLNVGILALRLGDEKLGDLIPFRMDGHAIFAYQLHRRLELAASLPITLLQLSNFDLLRDQGFPQQSPAVVALSDARVQARGLILDEADFPIGLAVIGELRAPTGNDDAFTGARSFVFAPRAAVERAFGPVRVIVNAGYRFRAPGQFLNLYVGNDFHASTGVIWGLNDYKRLTGIELLAEMHLATPMNAPFTFEQADSLKSPWEIMVGGRARLFKAWGAELSIARGFAVQTGYGREAFRVIAGVRYDFSHSDRDNDGISDDVDACPDQAEDKDGFEDSDGCPDPDNDGDGILDGDDRCPLQPGSKEMGGCPDTDGDDIPDIEDKCPEEPGPPENEGCPFEDIPIVEVESDRIRVRGNVQFETASAQIQKVSYPLLDEVAKVLVKNPNLGPVIIEGHTDNVGGAAYNKDLSFRRARSVEDYLVKQGIDRKRLSHAGFGFERPVATNDTPLGRAKNRRVDFKLTQDSDESGGGSDSVKPTGNDATPPPQVAPEPKSDAKPEAAPDAGTK